MPLPITLQATNEAQLNADIAEANSASSGTYVIDVSSLVENADLTAIDLKSGVALTINGGSTSTYIDGAGNYRGLFVYSGAVTIESLTLQDMTAAGGNGASGGGGGAGLGGALFVASGGAATLNNVDMSGNKAVGGSGSSSSGLIGGGGGMGGNGAAGGGGGEGANSSGGGGGGGGGGLGVSASGGAGAWSGKSPSAGQQSDILSGAGGGAGGASGKAFTETMSDGMGGTYSVTEYYSGGYGGAGGGMGGGPGIPGVGNIQNVSGGGSGGVGGFGGGGGGGGAGEVSADHSNFLTTGGNGGPGGFGGGGGGGAVGGSGGFGGGGGESVKGSSPGGAGGFGGGAGSSQGGGGGLGAGGDIFVQQGGSLNILGGELDEGTVDGGASVHATAGDAYGGGIFLQGDETITLGAGGAAGSVTTIEGDIADETGNGGGSANPGSGSINIAGDGTVIFEGAASYTGTTDVEQGATLQVGTGGAGGAFNHSGALTVDGEIIVDLSDNFGTQATLSGSGEIAMIGSGVLELKGAGSGFSGEVELQNGELALPTSKALGSGVIRFDGAATLELLNSSLAGNTIENFAGNDAIEVTGLGGYLPAAPHIALPASFSLSISGDTVTQTNGDGSKEVTTYDITGQSFTTKLLDYDAKGLIVAKYYEGVTGQGNLSAFEYLYGGNNLIGTDNYYSDITGESYTAEETDYDGDSRLTRAAYSGVSGAPYSSFEYDYVGGVFSGSKFTYTTVPAGASYSSYVVDYNQTGALNGVDFFFTNLSGVGYAGEEADFNADDSLMRIVLTGVDDQLYSSLELDYSAGSYEGYKAYYMITGQSYTNEEVDVSASGQLEKVIYSGMTGTPYQTVEQGYSNGALADTIYGYTDVTGQTYNTYQVMENASGAALQETFDLNSGGHTLIALASGQTLTSLGGDKMTGDGATTFVFDAIYGADTITNFNSADTISLPISEFANFAAVRAAATQSGANVLITPSDGDTLTLKNMTTATLAAMGANFTFHA